MDAALELFAENGIAGTSLREIRIAADQAHVGAIHYHFEDKQGLLRSLLERELPALVERREELLASVDSVWSTAAVFVLPFAEFATGAKHQRWVVRFLSQLHDDPSLSLEDLVALIGDTRSKLAYELLRKYIPELPALILAERVSVGIGSYLHAAAERAAGYRRQLVDDQTFRRNIVDMFLGALSADFD
jgi:AcrR family transcriptional regulator